MITALLAQPASNPTGPEFGKASPLGLVIILVLLAGTVLLIRSMNKHIKRLPAEFSPEHPEPDQQADDGTDHGAVPDGQESEADRSAGAPDEGESESARQRKVSGGSGPADDSESSGASGESGKSG